MIISFVKFTKINFDFYTSYFAVSDYGMTKSKGHKQYQKIQFHFRMII